MEIGVTCYARGIVLLSVSSKHSTALVSPTSISPSCSLREEFLIKATPDKRLVRLMMFMGEALRTITFKVRTASCGGTACVNSFGDEQLAVDLLANKLLFEALTYSNFCNTHAQKKFLSFKTWRPCRRWIQCCF